MKKKINYSTIIGLLVCCGLIHQPAFSAPPAANIIPQASTINAHDMENLKRMKIETRVRKDFQNYEETKEDEQKLEEGAKKKGPRVKKAPLENYATEGVYINNIEVSPSQILTEKELNDIIKEYTQTNLTIEQIKNILFKINELYAEKGFLTARAYVPPQSIDNETIKIVLVEGKVGNVNISETRWTRKKCIEKFLHLKKGEIFNISTLEQDILTFNRYNDYVSLKGNIVKGVEQETTDVNIQAEEKFPYTMTFLTDNQGRESIGVYRIGLMLQAQSLTGHRDRFTVGAFKSKNSTTPFADYSIPINKKDGRVGLSYSYGLSQIDSGAYNIFNIKNRSHNYALYYYQPIVRKPWMEFASTSSVGYKISTTSFDGYDILIIKYHMFRQG